MNPSGRESAVSLELLGGGGELGRPVPFAPTVIVAELVEEEPRGDEYSRSIPVATVAGITKRPQLVAAAHRLLRTCRRVAIWRRRDHRRARLAGGHSGTATSGARYPKLRNCSPGMAASKASPTMIPTPPNSHSATRPQKPMSRSNQLRCLGDPGDCGDGDRGRVFVAARLLLDQLGHDDRRRKRDWDGQVRRHLRATRATQRIRVRMGSSVFSLSRPSALPVQRILVCDPASMHSFEPTTKLAAPGPRDAFTRKS